MIIKSSFKNIRGSGFSLIEVLVYIAVLMLMLSIIIGAVYSIARSSRMIRTVRMIENSAISALERIEYEVRSADAIVPASSVFGVHPGRLVLSGGEDEEEEGPLVESELSLSNGALVLSRGGVDLGSLTESGTTVTELVFTRFSSLETEGVRVKLTLSAGTSTHYRSESFYSSILLK